MDQFNVISLTSNLTDLKTDMANWANLPYNIRMRSDDECMKRYGMNNTELFNKLQAAIINNSVPKEPALIESYLIENEINVNNSKFSFEDIDAQDFNWRIQLAKQLETSPKIVLIIPINPNENVDYNLQELNYKYYKFHLLSPRNKVISNYYSMDLWGYTVEDMFLIMKQKLGGSEESSVQESSLIKKDLQLSPIIQDAEKKYVENDKIGLLIRNLDGCNPSMDRYSKTVYQSIENIDSELYDDPVGTLNIVPFFTPDEISKLSVINSIGDYDKNSYYKTLIEKKKRYDNETNLEEKENLANELISLGWNPSVDINEKNIRFAKDKQSKWIKEHVAKIVDISMFNVTSITEATNMEKIYKEKDLYPIYIVLSYSNTLYGNLIRKVKSSTYTHAGLCLNSDLQKICTFKFDFKYNGFWIESIDNYAKRSEDAIVDVLAVFVNSNTKRKVESALNDFTVKRKNTKYGFGNIFNILINREKNDPNDLALVCSQFVDTILKLANINITDKPTNLVIPQDFETISSNPKVFKLYEGLAKEYNKRQVDDLIYSLLYSYSLQELKYDELMKSLSENREFQLMFSRTENTAANNILQEIQSLLTVDKIITERKMPFKFTDNGDLSINLSKSLEQEYQEAHKLLIGYSKDNLEGIKHELARLYFINFTIEKKIKKMKRDDTAYKSFIDLRARVLNDFKKYFKIVSEAESDFNFTNYFEKSEYYNGNIVIDNSVLKFSGDLIKKFLKTQGS